VREGDVFEFRLPTGYRLAQVLAVRHRGYGEMLRVISSVSTSPSTLDQAVAAAMEPSVDFRSYVAFRRNPDLPGLRFICTVPVEPDAVSEATLRHTEYGGWFVQDGENRTPISDEEASVSTLPASGVSSPWSFAVRMMLGSARPERAQMAGISDDDKAALHDWYDLNPPSAGDRAPVEHFIYGTSANLERLVAALDRTRFLATRLRLDPENDSCLIVGTRTHPTKDEQVLRQLASELSCTYDGSGTWLNPQTDPI
jgi:hypothetical protein